MVTVVEKDRVGLLAEITDILEKSSVSIDSVSAELILGRAVIALRLSNPEKGRNALAARGYDVLAPEATLFVLTGRAEGPRSVAAMLEKGGVAVRKVRTLAVSGKKNLVCVLSDNPKKAATLLKGSAAFVCTASAD
jgi:hypothetical protein